MPKKSQPGGSTEESASTKPRKRTTKKPVDTSPNYSRAAKYWAQVQSAVLERTITSNDTDLGIRASNPRAPEDKDWWDRNGPAMVASWIDFMSVSGWKIYEFDGIPAIEVPIEVTVGNTFIKMVIDRVMVTPQGELVIVDLKTGRRQPTTTLQLAIYRYGIQERFGITIDTGYYWMARSSAMSDPVNLAHMNKDKIEYLLNAFDTARKSLTFIPNPSSCSMCGYTAKCIWYEGAK